MAGTANSFGAIRIAFGGFSQLRRGRQVDNDHIKLTIGLK
jgi:hypothetical protein